MTATAVPQPYTRQHAFSTSRNLLNLDCSADLKSYRRDLGPGVQAKCFEKTSDTIRAQLDHHRAFLLRHRHDGQGSGLPSPVPRLEVPPSHSAQYSTAPPHMTAPNGSYHVASHPRPLSVLSQPHAPQAHRDQHRHLDAKVQCLGTLAHTQVVFDKPSSVVASTAISAGQARSGKSSRRSRAITWTAQETSWVRTRVYRKQTCKSPMFSSSTDTSIRLTTPHTNSGPMVI
jgi:hypothetical protein